MTPIIVKGYSARGLGENGLILDLDLDIDEKRSGDEGELVIECGDPGRSSIAIPVLVHGLATPLPE